MKSILNLTALSILLFCFSCNNAPSGETNQAEDTTTMAKPAKPSSGSTALNVDRERSKVTWQATKLMGGGHNGSINISSGTVHIENGGIVAGSFQLDMNSILDLDLEDLGMKNKLETHLKSDEFFDVANYPTAQFDITSVSTNENGRQNITGNLTIKGITQSIDFNAKVAGSETAIHASTGNFVIDRTQWDVKYGSGMIGTAKDKIINDKVALDITLVASL